MVHPLLLPDLRMMLEEHDEAALREFATGLHPATVAEALEGLSPGEIWQVLSYAPLAQQAEVFPYFSLSEQINIVEKGGRERMSRIIEAMPSDDRADLLSRLDPTVVESLLPLVAHAERQDIRMLLSYPEGSAGARMTTDYASLPVDITAEEALVRLRRQAPDRETIYYIYVLDAQRHLLGLVTLRQLILARPTARVGDLMAREAIAVKVTTDQEELAKTLARYNFLAVPVVDDENRLVGIVTHDDVLDVLVEEATEDVHRMGAVAPMEEGYLEADFRTVWRKRAIWLSCLFVAELFTFTALAYFEDAISAVVALSLFVPLCISTGGNSGSQAATLITRALALGQVRNSDWSRVLRHELSMGLVLGLTLGGIAFVRALATPEKILTSSSPRAEAFRVRVSRDQALEANADGTVRLPPRALQFFAANESVTLTLPEGTSLQSADDADHDHLLYDFPPKTTVRRDAVSRWRLGMVISQSVAVICLWGTLVGSMLPLVFRQLGFDPGYASSPFVATFVDVTGIVIYFSIAQIYILR